MRRQREIDPGRLLQFAAVAVLFAAVAGCATDTMVINHDSHFAERDRDCAIRFFKDEKPRDHYELISEIETHIKKNFFFAGTVQLEDEAYRELRSHACKLGGDAIIIDDYIESSATEMTHVHVWASVIKFTK